MERVRILLMGMGFAVAVAACPWGDLAVNPYAPVKGDHNPKQSTAHADVYDVAQGFRGIKIQRVIPKDPTQPSYILKKYRNSYGPEKRNKELEGIKYLAKLRDGNPSIDTFNIVKVLDDVTRVAVKLEDIRGRNLPNVLGDHRIPEPLRKRILEAYERKLANLTDAIQTSAPPGSFRVRTITHRGATIAEVKKTDPSNSLFHLIISPEQVVATFDPKDPNLFTLTIVDPY